ncbi:MAG: cyclophilin-like fold protein [Deltaproteobacteria bacterium]|nr:cyclophilin-like fold protein [Deltaproteobacteria bacterium]
MDRGIRIQIGDVVLQGELHESPTASLIWEALPIEGKGNRWGEEIYFAIPVKAELDETARAVVERGDLGYWPQGHALCIFFGPTPVSRGDEIRPASPVNIVGNIKGDLRVLKEVAEGTIVRLDKKE